MPDLKMPFEVDGEPPKTGREVILHPTLGRSSEEFTKIVKYVEGLKGGMKPRAAAKGAGTTLGELKRQGTKVQKYLAKARAEYSAEASDLREMTVLQWVERALRQPGEDGYDPREAMIALNEISKIPEVGLKGKGAPGAAAQTSFSEEAQAVLDAVDIEEGEDA
jgi:hypothetical protein